jgi:hypothetical protein
MKGSPAENRILAARIIFLLLGAFLTVFGCLSGGFRENWMKACLICLECIGLG